MRSVNGQPSNFKEPKNTVSDRISKKIATAHLLLPAAEPGHPSLLASRFSDYFLFLVTFLLFCDKKNFEKKNSKGKNEDAKKIDEKKFGKKFKEQTKKLRRKLLH